MKQLFIIPMLLFCSVAFASQNNIGTIDEHSGAACFIEVHEAELHDGHAYSMEGFTTLAADAALTVSMVVAVGCEPHFSWDIASNGILTTYFYEDCVSTTGGNAVTPLNRNRNCADASCIVVAQAPDVNRAGATLISQKKVGGAGFKTTFGGSDSPSGEIILKADTIYCRVFRSDSADNIISFKASWIE